MALPDTTSSTVANGNGHDVDRSMFSGNPTNGLPTNGATTNGYATNGLPTNGTTTNGYATNGHHVNGVIASGDSRDGHHSNGVIANGDSRNGYHANGVTVNGGFTNGHPSTSIPVSGVSSNLENPIAICGMAVRLPGGLATPQQLWEFLLAKGDARGRVPETRYNVSAYHFETAKPGSTITEHGYFLDQSVDLGALDTSFFTMPRTEVERADPQQRLMLEVARECFEDAGVTNWSGRTIGCYIGSFGEDWVEMFAKEPQQWGVHRIVGYGDFALSNRVSYEMDLHGPSMTVRTGCSAALVGLNEACMAISRGDCESALVGGVNLIMAPGMTTAMSEQGVLSKDGSCKTFSADANGYGRGEAITAIYVKPLSDAIRDGNPIRAVIRSTSTNVDGKTPGMSCPSTDAQEALIRRAYKVAGITDFGLTAMVECHGTGTPIGDPIEANAVARVFGESGVYIGSIKPNLGHAEGASGLVSVIKMVLALEHRIIPPNICFTNPNPAIPFKSAKLTVPLEPSPWPYSRHERVSVNSFGIGGANAHVILDSAASFNASTVLQNAPTTPQLLLYSANSKKSLTRMIANVQQYVEKHPNNGGDLAYTLANRREHLPHRAFAIANSGAIGNISPLTKTVQKPNIVMVFSGQGAQWPLMGRELLQNNATFRSSIRFMDNTLQAMTEDAPQYSIEKELLKSGKKSRLSTAELSQPLCTAIQIALVDALKSLKIEPDAVVGHSSGEIAAAYAAGALTAGEAIIAAHHRGAVTTRQKRAGAMAAISMSWEDTEKYLISKVTVACDNSPGSVTISGDADEVKAVIADIHKSCPDVVAKLLQVDKAYHSYHMAEIGGYYRCLIGQKMTGIEPTKLFFSMRFREAVTSILKHEIGQNAVFVEIGPHSALAGPLRQIFTQASSPAPYVSAMIRNQNCTESFLSVVGKLHSLKVPIDLESLIPNGCCLPDLPRYPWNHEDSYWYEPRLCKEWRLRKYPYHDLLGVKMPESTDIEPVWRNLLHLQNAPWIRDHKVADDIIFPFAGYIAIAGEAVRQLSGSIEGFSLRNIIVSMALVLPEGNPTEIVTTFRQRRLTTSLNSQWWEFTIASYNGHVWNKHCTGETTALISSLGPAQEPETLPRKVGARKWYETMQRAGLELGPSFQTLQTIETSTNAENQARGRVANGRQGDEKNYYIHPTVLDGTLQLLGAAAVNGHSRKYKNWLPTSIEKLSVSRCSADMVSSVSARATSNSSVVGEGRCSSEGITVLEVSGIRISLAEGSLSTHTQDTHAAARYEWSPDIDFMDMKEVIRPPIDRTSHMLLLDELSQLCLLSSKRSFSGLKTEFEHMQKYIAWIESHAPSTDPAASSLNHAEISVRIENLVHRLSDTPAASAATALHRVCTKVDLLLSGQNLEGVISDEVLTNLYKFIDECDISKFIQHLGHSKPNLRILEIGTGRGSSAKNILKGLTRVEGQILCSEYTLTSKGFICAKDQQKLFQNMEFATLDIGNDPWEQGFEGRQYDLVIATNVLHVTKSLQESLMNIRKLLHPDGRLLFRELCPLSKWVNYIFGVQPSWWCGSADGRPDEPCVGTEKWKSKLLTAGFDGLNGLVLDSEGPCQLTATIIARPITDRKAAKRVTLLCDDQGDSGPVLHQLEKSGYQVVKCKIEDPPPPEQDVISILDRDRPFLEAIDTTRFQSFKRFLHNLGDAGIFWITPVSQIGCQDPSYAQVIGLARTIRTEMLIDFATCEVDKVDSSPDKTVQTFAKFQMREENDLFKPDFEYVIRNGKVNVGRFYPFALQDKLLIQEPSDRAILDVGTPGRLNTLHWSRQAVVELQSDEVEVDVFSVGLKFRDVLVGMGIVELPQRAFGLEAAGVIRRIGSKVNGLKIGDRVACLERHAFSTLIITPELLCVKIPDVLSFNEAATMLIPFATVIYSLVNVGGLVTGQSVLLHSACGGVGLAAIQISQMLGADVYVTVGNDEKVRFLMENFNIPRHRIFNSRNDSFVEGIMHETKGEGVDLVLNSLSGELLHASWTCVAAFGKMVEIGKRDLIGGGKLDMNNFLANRSYCCVDIDQFRKRPMVLKQLLNTIMEYFQKGYISPIRPMKIFKAASIEDAFRYMQKGQHIGRIGVSVRESPEDIGLDLGTTKRTHMMNFHSSASYLLIGGLGGLGRAISAWMADHNARELAFLSRSAGTGSGDESFVNELNSMGCDVKLVRGDVTNPEDVARAFAAFSGPLKGIIQMSMVLRDQNFTSMTFDEWSAVTAPKIQGTWNLHDASIYAGADLDFFVLFSSLSGIIGQPGQANYASANTFLDAFAQYRQGLGLPASVIDIGAVEDIGFISQNQGLMNKMKSTGFKGITEQELLNAMAVAMMPRSAREPGSSDSGFVDGDTFVLGLGSTIPLSSLSNRAVWRKDRRMAAYHNAVSGSANTIASNETLKTHLASAKADPSILKTAEVSNLFAIEIGKKLFDLLLKPHEDLNTAWTLVDLGLDSLVALELRAWWKQVFSFDISVLEMLGMGSLDALGQHVAESLLRIATEQKEKDGSE